MIFTRWAQFTKWGIAWDIHTCCTALPTSRVSNGPLVQFEILMRTWLKHQLRLPSGTGKSWRTASSIHILIRIGFPGQYCHRGQCWKIECRGLAGWGETGVSSNKWLSSFRISNGAPCVNSPTKDRVDCITTNVARINYKIYVARFLCRCLWLKKNVQWVFLAVHSILDFFCSSKKVFNKAENSGTRNDDFLHNSKHFPTVLPL